MVADRDLAVGADVDKEAQATIAVEAAGEDAGGDVATDVGAERREDVGGCVRVDLDAEIGRAQAGVVLAGHHKRCDTERLGVDAERDLRHRGVAGEHNFVDLIGAHTAGFEHLEGQLGERLVGEVAELRERVGVHHRRGDAADHIGTEGLLLVEHAADRDRRAGVEIEQVGDHGRGAKVDRHREAATRGVARLDSDQLVVGDHGGDLEVGGAQRFAERAQDADRRVQLEIVDRVVDTLDVGALVGQRRLFQLQEALDDRGAQDHLTANTYRCGLRTSLQWRHVELEIVRGRNPTGQPPAGPQLVGRKRARVELRERSLAADDLDLALATRAVPTTGRIDRDAVPRRRIEDRHTTRHLDVDAAGCKLQANACRRTSLDACVGLVSGAHAA